MEQAVKTTFFWLFYNSAELDISGGVSVRDGQKLPTVCSVSALFLHHSLSTLTGVNPYEAEADLKTSQSFRMTKTKLVSKQTGRIRHELQHQ